MNKPTFLLLLLLLLLLLILLLLLLLLLLRLHNFFQVSNKFGHGAGRQALRSWNIQRGIRSGAIFNFGQRRPGGGGGEVGATWRVAGCMHFCSSSLPLTVLHSGRSSKNFFAKEWPGWRLERFNWSTWMQRLPGRTLRWRWRWRLPGRTLMS